MEQKSGGQSSRTEELIGKNQQVAGELFASRGGDPQDENCQDMFLLYDFCCGCYEDFGIKNFSDPLLSRLLQIIHAIPGGLTRNFDAPTPSPFKRAAVFTWCFMLESPLVTPFSNGNLPTDITGITNHQNAIAAFEYSRRALMDAKIFKKNPEKEEILSEPIRVSRHFYCDTIHAIAQLKQSTSEENLMFLALLYEALAYKANRNISYPEVL